jgi:LysM repeat protein
MYCNKTPLWIFGLAVGLLIAQTASAMKYKTRPNESLFSVARLHYGDQKKVIYLMAANGITNPDKFDHERTLWVPTVWRYAIKRGEDLAQIAARHLKDPKRADFLLWLNHIANPLDIKPQTMLTMPFLLPHRVLPGQSLVDITRQYYFSVKEIALVRKFNNKHNDALNPGETLDIPIFDPEASVDKVRERLKHYQDETVVPTATPVASTTAPPKAASRSLPDQIKDARDLFDDGEYELAQTAVMRLLEQKLSANEELQTREVLAFCLAAQDRYSDAEHEFVHLLLIAPEYTLDPISASPKIQEILQRARQAY